MAVLDIVLYPDVPLRDKASPYDAIDAAVADLARDMVETMFAFDGVGLAGPQIGVSKRILVLCEPGGETQCLVNPEISFLTEDRVGGEEGCLSLPQVYATVPRAPRIHVRAFDEKGKLIEFDAEDFLARIIQHENDHLNGIVFPDRLDILSREDVLHEWENVRKQMTTAAQHGPGGRPGHRSSEL